jgi:hypothetical protein
VLILLSPLTWTGAERNGSYTFDLNTRADYRTRPVGGDWSAYDPTKSGTFGQVVDMIDASVYNTQFAAFFGPQIGMSGTYNTTFTVSQIELQTVPVPGAVWLLASGLLGLVTVRRRMKK